MSDTETSSSISAAGGSRLVSFELPLPIAIFAGLSTWLALSGLTFIAGGLASRLLMAVLS